MQTYFDTYVLKSKPKVHNIGHTKAYQKTIAKLVQTRGYEFTDDDDPDSTYRIAKDTKQQRQLLLCQYTTKVGIHTTRDLEAYVTPNIQSICVVTTIGISTSARRYLEHKVNVPVTIFHAQDLQCNYVSHTMIPKHQRLSSHDKTNFLKTYRSNHLPKYELDDPVVKYHGWVKGDIIQIDRRFDDTQELHRYYRIVA